MPYPDRNVKRESIVLALVAFTLALGLQRLWPGYFLLDDNLNQYQPAQVDITRAWIAGQLPLTTISDWHGGALAGEYQYAIFAPVRQILGCVSVLCIPDPSWRAATLAALYLGFCMAGFYCLARALEITRPLAVSAAFCSVFSGYLINVAARNWLPMMTSFAWIPWHWLSLVSLRRSEAGSARWAAWHAFFLANIALEGWPLTWFMAALLTFVYLPLQWRKLRWLVGGSLVGLGMASPGLWMFHVHLQESMRNLSGDPMARLLAPGRLQPLQLILGSLVPDSDLVTHVAVADSLQRAAFFQAGVLPFAAAVTWMLEWTVRKGRDEKLMRLSLVVFLAVLGACLPPVAGLRWPVRWAPLILAGIALLGHKALDSGYARLNPSWIGLICLALIPLGVPAFRSWAGMKALIAPTVAMLAWAVTRRLPAPLRDRSCAVLCLSCLSYGTLRNHVLEQMGLFPFPHFPIPHDYLNAAPFDPGRRYLVLYSYPDMLKYLSRQAWTLEKIGEAPAAAGLDFVNGYSSMVPLAMALSLGMDVHGWEQFPRMMPMLKGEYGPKGLLATWGVDGLVLAPELAKNLHANLVQAGWSLQTTADGYELFRRNRRSAQVYAPRIAVGCPNAQIATGILLSHKMRPPSLWIDSQGDDGATYKFSPLVPPSLLTDSQAKEARVYELAPLRPSSYRVSRGRIDVDVSASKTAGLLVLTQPFRLGLHADLAGAPLSVYCYNLAAIAVLVPPGEGGHIRVQYWPNGLTPCLYLSLTCVALMLLAGFAHSEPGAREQPGGRSSPARPPVTQAEIGDRGGVA